jgi:hypothetical protein
LIVLLAVLMPVIGSQALAGGFDACKAAFNVRFGQETTPYRVTGVFVLPGEQLTIEALTGGHAAPCRLHHSAGRVVEEGENRWVWQAPGEVGDTSVRIVNPALRDSVTLNVFVMAPFERLTGEYLNGYRIGNYPTAPSSNQSLYHLPRGFIELTEENQCTLVGPHFMLGQFACKQESDLPRYIVLRERLILKLELILEKVNQEGYACNTFHIMSGYRTPHYNHAIGNVRYSRHLWGGAADFFIDASPEDGMMDDLNRDDKIDYRDAQVVYDIIDAMHDKPWYEPFMGGLAWYRKTSDHGPFVHIDVRGCRARW